MVRRYFTKFCGWKKSYMLLPLQWLLIIGISYAFDGGWNLLDRHIHRAISQRISEWRQPGYNSTPLRLKIEILLYYTHFLYFTALASKFSLCNHYSVDSVLTYLILHLFVYMAMNYWGFLCVCVCDVWCDSTYYRYYYCTVHTDNRKQYGIEDRKLRMELGTNFKLCDRLLDNFWMLKLLRFWVVTCWKGLWDILPKRSGSLFSPAHSK